MVDAELLEPVGQSRGRYYVARPVLRREYERIRADRAPKETADPFKIAAERLPLAF